ncbi:hypothetical protein NEOLEDRAFT_435320 [Neolentinus lepideus HHB14362 ss-1]|uniref:Uncharacterized protein n=1 Tax=Neolentinus lepideus HHB14362 ss-1 TaxID=1314782 RepID=A0A165RW04_9AGAM|nr:hypothetical protein NEOLEDRAFT_435320 [Neolentinus lepideus HHB14362 ss-1]
MKVSRMPYTDGPRTAAPDMAMIESDARIKARMSAIVPSFPDGRGMATRGPPLYAAALVCRV